MVNLLLAFVEFIAFAGAAGVMFLIAKQRSAAGEKTGRFLAFAIADVGFAFVGPGLMLFEGPGFTLLFAPAMVIVAVREFLKMRSEVGFDAPVRRRSDSRRETVPVQSPAGWAAHEAQAAPVAAPATPRPQVPPGWYPDPIDPSVHRWWDGYRWTKFTQATA